eukprot:m.13110 g.13110  ORF g.13110 m.13110 type:complete len:503 (-) comp4793_c0_seq2:81-1589(-)
MERQGAVRRMRTYEPGSEAKKSLVVYGGNDDEDYLNSFQDEDLLEDIPEEHQEHVGRLSTAHVETNYEKKKHHFKVKWPKKLHTKHHKEHAVRKQVLLEAQEYGESEEGKAADRHLTVVYNPISGAGVAKKIVDHFVEPVLRLAGLRYDIVATEYRGFAIEYLMKIDPTKTDGVLIAGGDGLVHECVTGYFRRPDVKEIDLPLGLIPSGTANAMAHELHAHETDYSHSAVILRAALAAAKGHTRRIDVLKHTFSERPTEPIFALSVFGWGLAGTVAKTADELRWIPGQKGFRYDLAGFVSMMKDWPPTCKCTISYPKEGEPDGWAHEEASLTNMAATNLSWLGVDHPMTQDVTPDDGFLVTYWVPSTVKRTEIISMGMKMKKGHYLMEFDKVRTIKITELKIKVDPDQDHKIDMLIDGDPYEPGDVHVEVLHQGLEVFAEPKTINGPVMVKRKKEKHPHTPLTPLHEAAPIGESTATVEEQANADNHVPEKKHNKVYKISYL